jgi:hemolysin III
VAGRSQSPGEEIANSVSHGLALAAAIAAAPFLFLVARPMSASSVVAAAVYAATMMLLFLASTLYHALPASRAKRVFMRLDHGAIFVFIAGSYTPFLLGALEGAWGWALLGVVWSLAACGVTLKACNRLSHPAVTTSLYVGMGWLVLVAAVPLSERVPLPGIALLVAGGIAYTAGVVFFVLDEKVRYAHAVWHGFVVAGTAFHYFAVLDFAA